VITADAVSTTSGMNSTVLNIHAVLLVFLLAVESLAAKRRARATVRSTMSSADQDDLADLQASVDKLSEDIRETSVAIEQIAVGSVDLEVLVDEQTEIDWRRELNQILTPVLQSALSNIEASLALTEVGPTRVTLEGLSRSWTQRAEEYTRDLDVATAQLINLQRSDESLWVQVRAAVSSFLKGRGLTLLLAVVASLVVYYSVQFLAKGRDHHGFLCSRGHSPHGIVLSACSRCFCQRKACHTAICG